MANSFMNDQVPSNIDGGGEIHELNSALCTPPRKDRQGIDHIGRI